MHHCFSYFMYQQGGRFHTPKEYNPNLVNETERQHQISNQLGFDDDSNNYANYRAIGVPVDVHKHNEQIANLEALVAELQTKLRVAESNEATLNQKISNIQLMNRSQVTMFKSEIMKNAQKKKRALQLATFYKAQSDYLLSQTNIPLPDDLVEPPPASDDEAEADEPAIPVPAAPTNNLNASAASSSHPSEDVKELKEKNETLVKKLKQLASAYQSLQKKAKTLEEQGGGAPAAADQPSSTAITPAGPALGQYLPVLMHMKKQLSKLRNETESLKRSVTEKHLRVASEVLNEGMSYIHHQASLLAAANQTAVSQEEMDQLRTAFVKEVALRRHLHNQLQELRGNIRVVVRVRPILPRQDGPDAVQCVELDPDSDDITLVKLDDVSKAKKKWTFDRVLGTSSTQAQLFEELAPLVVSALDGYSVCVFAYGQTGSGKTHSMQGSKDNPGVYSRTFDALFKEAKDRASQLTAGKKDGMQGWSYTFSVSVTELYLDEFKDLLRPQNGTPAPKLVVKKDPATGMNGLPDLTKIEVRTPDDVSACLETAAGARSVGQTNMNEHSSRSHLILTIHITFTSPDSSTAKRSAQLHLVDLAGSERLAKSGVEGMRAKEAVAINTSLTALGDVVGALAAQKPHIPYRNSPLTMLLQDALGGDSKTLMLLQLSPTLASHEESNCSLQFAARVNAVETQVVQRR